MAKRTSERMIHDVDNDNPLSKKRCEDSKKLPKIFDGVYYEVIEHDNETKSISARCKKCIKEKIIRGKSTSTGNFYQHFSRTHVVDHGAMKEYCDERNEKKIDKKAGSPGIQTILPFATGLLDPAKVLIDKFFNIFFSRFFSTRNKILLTKTD